MDDYCLSYHTHDLDLRETRSFPLTPREKCVRLQTWKQELTQENEDDPRANRSA